jgi:hypothetical protein
MYRASAKLSDYQGRIGENAIFFQLPRRAGPARVAPQKRWTLPIGTYEGLFRHFSPNWYYTLAIALHAF